MPVVWSDAHRLHEPGGGTWVGLPAEGDELPARAEAIRRSLETAEARIMQAVPHDDAALLAVHDSSLVGFLRDAHARWQDAGYPDDPGQDRVVGYIFPHPGLLGGLAPLEPASAAARTGLYAFDTMTTVGPGTWAAARGAVDAALTAADLVCDGAPAAYACTRPPGHHVTRSTYGGSCYLNNAAVAAEQLRRSGSEGVAIVDVDAHHGNGAQEIFWQRGDVLSCSVHVDPEAGWFPHFLGTAAERGAGEGAGRNLNLPLAPGTGDHGWLEAVGEAVAAVHREGSEALVVALGVDAAASDPNSPLEATEAGYRAAGRLLGGLRLPTVIVQEGGYDLTTLGGLVLAALEGFEEAKP